MQSLRNDSKHDYPNYAAEIVAEKQMLQLEEVRKIKRRKDDITILDIKCFWCDCAITDEFEDFYYKCEHHNKSFCSDCAKWNDKVVWERKENGHAPYCKELDKQDCIYSKVLIK